MEKTPRSILLSRHADQSHALLGLKLIFSVSGVIALMLSAGVTASAQDKKDLDSFLPNPVRSVSTVPPNGDVNPYGVSYVPNNFYPVAPTALAKGDILVSNFNNSSNLQGTGTTIVRIPSKGKVSTFFRGPKGVGLSTALNVLS